MKRNYLFLVLKGIAMGAADVVPGVSGGTIAFISGIYEELVNSIKNIDFTTLKLLFTFKWKEFWKRINGNFLLAIVAGIGISIFSLAKLMTYLLATHPIQIWSFFFGLIIASCLMVGKEVKRWNVQTVISLLAGIAIAYSITVLTPASTPQTWWFIFLSGAIAICAMILPGISGAFILLLMGQYAFLMEAIGEFRIGIILIFAAGALIGIVSFSHLLSWLLKHYHHITIALLTGFMAGSLNKVWPWKQAFTGISDKGEITVLEKSILPGNFEGEPLIGQAIIFCIIGFLLIWGIEKIGNRLKEKNNR